MSLHVSAEELKILQEILQDHPGCVVFGSRVKGTYQEYSDLDLCFIRDVPVTSKEVSLLKEACEQSDLPFIVDIIDYHKVSDSFKKIIDKDKINFPYKKNQSY